MSALRTGSASQTTATSHDLDRRGFVKIVLTFIGTIITAIIGLPAISYLISPANKVQKTEDWIPAGKLDAYPIGVPTLFSFTRSQVNGWEKTVNSYGVYVLRESETAVRIFSNKCTHLSCRVTWHEDLGEYICPCHDGRFAKDGRVTKDPPPEPLHEYAQTEIREETLYFFLKEG